jgi:hypothetical protein
VPPLEPSGGQVLGSAGGDVAAPITVRLRPAVGGEAAVAAVHGAMTAARVRHTVDGSTVRGCALQLVGADW